MTSVAVASPSDAKASIRTSSRLRGVSGEPAGRAEAAARDRDEVGQLDGIRHDLDRGGRRAQPEQLAALGLAHRQQARRAVQHAAPDGVIEHPLERPATLDARRGPVRREHVRHTGGRQPARRDGGRHVVARVQMGDVEVARVLGQPRVHPPRQEQLQMVGERVGDVGEDAHLDAGGAGGAARARPRLGGVGGAHGHLVAAPREAAGQGRRGARHAAVRPRFCVVRRHLEHPQRRHPFNLSRFGGGRLS